MLHTALCDLCTTQLEDSCKTVQSEAREAFQASVSLQLLKFSGRLSNSHVSVQCDDWHLL